MKVNVISRSMIKPCTPTPSHLRTYKLSLMDELNPTMHIFRIIYYPSDVVNAEKLVNLKVSLSKLLPQFYPLAGRYLKEKQVVDCNDDGAEYAESEVDCKLHQLTGYGAVVIPKKLNNLLPLAIGAVDEVTDPMLAVQVNKFQCGGIAIGVCASHRILDAASVGIFLKAWAATAAAGAKGEIIDVVHPDFSSPSFFPGENIPFCDLGISRTTDDTIVARRFVFNKNTISKLRDQVCVGQEWSRPPSKVALVSSVLTRALLRAFTAKRGGNSTTLIIAQAINIRGRTVPPLPEYACGSWASMSYVDYTTTEESQSLAHYVTKMKEATTKDVRNCAKILSDKEVGRWIMVDSCFEAVKKPSNPNVKLIWNTDWTKFGDYELDFGFGKPLWVSLAACPLQDMFVLTQNNENDGIETWVYLHQSDMHYLDQDEDLRTLTTQ